MNRVDATPTSAPEVGRRRGAGRAADAEGHRFAWHPVQQPGQEVFAGTDENLRADAGIPS